MNKPYAKPALYFGKYKEKPIEEFSTRDEMNYLYWIRNNPDIWKKLNQRTKDAINLKLDGKLPKK